MFISMNRWIKCPTCRHLKEGGGGGEEVGGGGGGREGGREGRCLLV